MVDHRRRTTRRTALFADTLEDDSSVSPTTTPFLASSCYRRLLLSFSLCSLRRFHGEPRFRFQAFPPRASRQRKDLQITGKEYQRRISEVLSVGDRAGSCSTPEHPFLGPMGYIRPSAIDIIRLFRDNLPRIVRYRCFLLFFFFSRSNRFRPFHR